MDPGLMAPQHDIDDTRDVTRMCLVIEGGVLRAIFGSGTNTKSTNANLTPSLPGPPRLPLLE
jgi:hypothetical protein